MVLNFFRPLAFFVILWTMYRPYANKALFIKTTLHPAADYTTAHRTCLRHNMSMVFPDHFLSTTEEEQFWLPIRRNRSMPWTWLDGTPYVGKSIGRRHNCALIWPKDKFIDEADCHRRRYGFICFHSVFSEGNCRGNDRCIKVKDAEVDVHPGPVTWYEAANVCRQLGTQLFFFDSRHQQEVLDVVGGNAPGPVWIGLRRRDFAGLDNRLYNWQLQRPERKFGCAVMSSSSGLWRTEDCSAVHRFVCQRNVSGIPSGCATKSSIPGTSAATRESTTRTSNPTHKRTTASSVTPSVQTAKADCTPKAQTCQCPLSQPKMTTRSPLIRDALRKLEPSNAPTETPAKSSKGRIEFDMLHIALSCVVGVLLLVVGFLSVAVYRLVRTRAPQQRQTSIELSNYKAVPQKDDSQG